MTKKIKSYSGLNKIKKKLTNGTVKEIYYWRGLKGVPALPGKPGDSEFELAFRAGPPKAEVALKPVATFASVIDAYERSNDFATLAPRTKSDYTKFIKVIREKWGTTPLAPFERDDAERKFRLPLLDWRDEWARRSARQAQYCFIVMGKICNVGIDRGIIKLNPCSGHRTRSLYKSDRATIIWSDHGPDNDIEAFLADAPRHLRLPLILAAYTGQREGDLLKLRYRDPDGIAPYYDGKAITLRVNKTKEYARIPILPFLKEVLDAEVARAMADDERQKWDEGRLLVTMGLTPWTEDGFRSSFFKARDKARDGKGIKTPEGRHKTFHDLRGTAVTMLGLAGCTTLQIAAITAHSEKTVSQILAAHYLGERTGMAEEAMELMGRWFAKRTDVSSANYGKAA